jgi:hypothetical protein
MKLPLGSTTRWNSKVFQIPIRRQGIFTLPATKHRANRIYRRMPQPCATIAFRQRSHFPGVSQRSHAWIPAKPLVLKK